MEYEDYGKKSFRKGRGGNNRSGQGFGGGFGGGRRFGGGGPRFGGSFRSTAPVKVGDELEVTIEAIAQKGDGVAKKEGFVIFVPGTKIGDKVTVRITKVLRKVGFAEVIGAGSEPSSGAAPEPSEEAPGYKDTEDFGEEQEESQENKESENEENEEETF